LQKRYPTKGKSINCSNVVVEDSDISILQKRLEKISRTSTDDSIVLGTVAGLDVPFKGQKYVIQSLSKLNSNKYIYKVVGTGTGKLLKDIAERLDIKKSLIIKGPMKHDEVFNFLVPVPTTL